MIVRVQRHEPGSFSTMRTEPLRDPRLSFRARGLWAHSMTHGEAWEISSRTLVSNREGRDAVRTALRELEVAGLARLENPRLEGGTLSGKAWVIYEMPIEETEEPKAGISGARHRRPEKPKVGSTENRKIRPHRRSSKKKTIQKVHPDPLSFDAVWDAYAKKESKAAALRAWERLNRTDQLAAERHIPAFVAATTKQFRPHLAKYLKNRRWEDEELPGTPHQGDTMPREVVFA